MLHASPYLQITYKPIRLTWTQSPTICCECRHDSLSMSSMLRRKTVFCSVSQTVTAFPQSVHKHWSRTLFHFLSVKNEFLFSVLLKCKVRWSNNVQNSGILDRSKITAQTLHIILHFVYQVWYMHS